MKYLFERINPYKRRMIFGFSVKVTATLAELILPLLLSYVLESVILTLEVGRVIFYGGVMIAIAAIACVLNILANRMAVRVACDVARDLRRDLFAKTLSLSARQVDKFTIPTLETRITTDTYNVYNFLSMAQRMGVRAPIMLFGGIIVTLFVDPVLALVMIAVVPLVLFVTFSVAIKGVSLYADVQRAQDGMVRVVREDSQGIRVIKALSKVEHEKEHYDEKNRRLASTERRAGRIMAIPNPIMTLLMNLGICGVVAISAYRVAENLSSAADVIAFMQYFTLISMSMLVLSRIFISYTKCRASANRIAEVMETPEDFYILENSEKIDTDSHISFENVNFSYFGVRNNLENVNFSLKKCEHLGIIGGIGSGKSTLVRLIMRLYDVDGGRILIDGRDVKSYERDEFVSKFGVTLQSDFLYSDTIAENIRFGRDISDEDIKWAARVAQAEEFIDAIPDGYSHVLAQRGTNLSGGQRQRLLIARAIAAHPEILILDDASSALDYRTDAALRRALADELSGTTVVTVAQRVSSVKSCDLILVLDDGKVIGVGKHEELLAVCPEYKEISELQMGGDIID